MIELLINENIKKEVFSIKTLGKNNYQLIAGPYTSINTLKNDYFKLNKYGFDNLDIKKINETKNYNTLNIFFAFNAVKC